MRLLTLEISRVRNLSSVAIDCSPGLNVFIGPNGAGKTAIIEAVYDAPGDGIYYVQLVGEAADPELVATVREIALADPAVTGLGVVLTMHLGPDDVLLNIEVQFTPGLPAEDIHTVVHRIEERITDSYPEVSRIFIEVEALSGGADVSSAAGPVA